MDVRDDTVGEIVGGRRDAGIAETAFGRTREVFVRSGGLRFHDRPCFVCRRRR